MSNGTMLQTLAKFFESKGRLMECSEYCAHVDAPYSRQLIRKAFKSYKLMIQKIEAMPKVKPKPVKSAKKKTSGSKYGQN